MTRVRIVNTTGTAWGTRVEVDGRVLPCLSVSWDADADSGLATATIVTDAEIDVVALDVHVDPPNVPAAPTVVPDPPTPFAPAWCAYSNCGDRILYVPGNGFGREGEWRHTDPPTGIREHDPIPQVHVT